jgi:zinc protease
MSPSGLDRRRLLGALGASVAGCSFSRALDLPRPLLQSEVSVLLPVFEQRVLPSGLQLLAWAREDAPLAVVALAVRPPPAPGEGELALTGIVGALTAERTQRFGRRELAAAFAAIGAEPRVSLVQGGFVIQAAVLPEHFEPLLDLLAELVRAPALDPEDFEHRRREHVGRRRAAVEDPGRVGLRALRGLLGARREDDDSPASTAAVERARFEDVQLLQHRVLQPRRTAVVLTGRVAGLAFPLGQRHFEGWTPPAPPAPPPLPPGPPADQPSVLLIPWPGLAQVHVLMGRRLPILSPREEIAVDLAISSYLGKMRALRTEGGHSYGVNARLEPDSSGHTFVVEGAVDARIARRAIVACLDGLRVLAATAAPSDDWLGGARLAASQSGATGGTDSAGHGLEVAELFIADRPIEQPRLEARALAEVTAREVREAARIHLLADDVTVVLVGDRDLIRTAAREARLEPWSELEHAADE